MLDKRVLCRTVMGISRLGRAKDLVQVKRASMVKSLLAMKLSARTCFIMLLGTQKLRWEKSKEHWMHIKLMRRRGLRGNNTCTPECIGIYTALDQNMEKKLELMPIWFWSYPSWSPAPIPGNSCGLSMLPLPPCYRSQDLIANLRDKVSHHADSPLQVQRPPGDTAQQRYKRTPKDTRPAEKHIL